MGKKKQKRLKLSDQIRHAVKTNELSRYRIAIEVGISQSLMSRFMSGDRGLSMAALDRLADFLSLNITVDERTTTTKD